MQAVCVSNCSLSEGLRLAMRGRGCHLIGDSVCLLAWTMSDSLLVACLGCECHFMVQSLRCIPLQVVPIIAEGRSYIWLGCESQLISQAVLAIPFRILCSRFL